MKNHYWILTFQDSMGNMQEYWAGHETKNMSFKRIQLIKKRSSLDHCCLISCVYLGEFTEDEWNEEWE